MTAAAQRAASYAAYCIVLAMGVFVAVHVAGQHVDSTRDLAVASNVEAAAGRGAVNSASPATLPRVSADALLLSQVCYLEADFRHDDCAAIGGVLKLRAKRSRWTFARMAHAYSAIDSGTPRALLASKLPNGTVPGWTANTNTRWAALRRHAAAVMAGKVKSPCPGASQWGARDIPSDVRRARNAIDAGRWELLPCATANAFYRELPPERVLSANVARGTGAP